MIDSWKTSVNIAIVDDYPFWREQMMDNLKFLDNKFADVVFNITEFEDGVKLLESLVHFDLILIDYEMPNFTGLETVEQLSREAKTSKIIFFSGYDDLFHISRKTNTINNVVGFLLKTDSFEEVEFQITNAVKSILNVNYILIEHYIIEKDVVTGRNNKIYFEKVIDEKKILYIESVRKDIYVYMKNGDSFASEKTLKQWIVDLSNNEFGFSSRSYIVNFRYVNQVKKNEIILIDKIVLKLSLKYREEFLNNRRKYLFREEFEKCSL